jgi:hypothetical protein
LFDHSAPRLLWTKQRRQEIRKRPLGHQAKASACITYPFSVVFVKDATNKEDCSISAQNADLDTSAPILSVEEHNIALPNSKKPDKQTLFQWLRAWWYVRQNCADADIIIPVLASEFLPVKSRHWAAMKHFWM